MNDSDRVKWCSHRRAIDVAKASAVAARSEPDFAALYHEYRFMVEAQVRLSIPEADRLDVCQEVWMDVWRSAGTYKGDAPLGVWLRVVTRHRIHRWARNHSRKGSRLRNCDLTILPAIRRDVVLAIDLRRAFASLPKRRARVIALHLAGYHHHEIAALLGIEVGTSKSQKSKAVAAIGARLEA